MGLRVRLDQLLLDRRMSIAELADRTGLSAANLGLLRNGEAQAIRVATLEALCRELRCQPGDLLAYDSEDEPVGEPSPLAGEGVSAADG